MAVPKKPETIRISPIKRETRRFHLLGVTPMIAHDYAEKAKKELLFPSGRKNETDRQSVLKHDPLREYRESVRTLDDGPAAIVYPSNAFKAAMRTAALDTPGAAKAQIGRLVEVEGEWVHIYGVPALGMDMVRSAGQNHTPDVRTRAYQAEWACVIDVTYVVPMLNARSIANLVAAAGVTAGVGDWRVEKGSGNFGMWNIVNADDPTLKRVMAEGGREAQLAALEKPAFVSDEAESLFRWFYEEVSARGKDGLTSTNGTGELIEEELEEVLS